MRYRVLLALALVLFGVHSASAEFAWKHFGADPYAATRAEAMQGRESAFKKLGFPAEVVPLLVEATKTPGEKMRLVNGDTLHAMLSKGGAVHTDVRVAFVTPPVSDRMEYAAPGERWQVEWHGTTYVVVLPYICHNWSRGNATEACVEESFDVPIGSNVRWGIGSAIDPLPASACNAQRQGNGPWLAWYGRCDWCVGAIGYIRQILGNDAETYHKFRYQAVETHQTIRFDRRVQEDVIYVCIEYPDGVETCGVYTRPEDWGGRSHIDIPDSLFVVGNCPTE